MCGVFGFVAKDKGELNMKILERIARVTQRRGPHAWGMAWIDSRGRLKMFKQSGRISDSLGLLTMARDARMLIGHCRFATQGDPENNLNNHPHTCDGGFIVHNGVIHDYREIQDKHDLHPVTDCDSETLGLLIEQGAGDLLTRCVKATNAVTGSPLVLLGLWKPDRLVVVRRGNPLHTGETNRGYYLASLADGLPGEVNAVKNFEALEYGDTCNV